MKQLLLRVPDDTHRRLLRRAQRDGRSVNAVANDILLAAVDADQGTRQEQLYAKAIALGLLRAPKRQPRTHAESREDVIASTKGLGPFLDTYFQDERSRS